MSAQGSTLPKGVIEISHYDTSVLPMPGSGRPTSHRLTIHEAYGSSNSPDTQLIHDHLFAEGRFEESLALRIVTEASDIFRCEPTVLSLGPNITISGDIHGQFYDLLTILKTGGPNFLFLGDYVDRGYFGIECILYLFSLKISQPDSYFMLRGNHESRHLTEYFTFKKECLVKYSIEVYNACMDAFDTLPIAAVVNKQFLCIHAGLSPELHSLSDFNKIPRFKEISSSGMMCDVLWSDPTENFGHEDSPYFYLHNTARGCSYYYSYSAVSDFLRRNHLVGIIRGHEVQGAGFKIYKSKQPDSYPVLISIFSAPHYLDVFKNKAAVLHYTEGKIHIRQFNSVEHPFWLQNFTDAFTWSYPYIIKKTREIVLAILSICTEEELDESDSESRRRRSLERSKRVFTLKMKAVGKLVKNYTSMEQRARERAKGMYKDYVSKDYLTMDYFPSHEDDMLFDKIEVIGKAEDSAVEPAKNLPRFASLPGNLRDLDKLDNGKGDSLPLRSTQSMARFSIGCEDDEDDGGW